MPSSDGGCCSGGGGGGFKFKLPDAFSFKGSDKPKTEPDESYKKCHCKPMPKQSCGDGCGKKSEAAPAPTEKCEDSEAAAAAPPPPPPPSSKNDCKSEPPCGGDGPKDTIPRTTCGFEEECRKQKEANDSKAAKKSDGGCDKEEPKKRPCNCGKPPAPTPKITPCGCNGKGASCGPNTSCEVKPLSMKKRK